MTEPVSLSIAPATPETLAGLEGRIAILLPAPTGFGPLARRLDRLTRGALGRLAGSEAFEKLKPGEGMELAFPAGLAAEAVQVIHLPKGATPAEQRKAGATIGRGLDARPVTVIHEAAKRAVGEIALGILARAYDFRARKSEAGKPVGAVTLWSGDAAGLAAPLALARAKAEALFFTRDLVNEPANVLTTQEFASRLEGLRDLGVTVEVLERIGAGRAWHGRASGRGAGLGQPLEGRGDGMERRG